LLAFVGLNNWLPLVSSSTLLPAPHPSARYSITWSAPSRMDCGIVRPSAFAIATPTTVIKDSPHEQIENDAKTLKTRFNEIYQ
jgi:hypothetical protein